MEHVRPCLSPSQTHWEVMFIVKWLYQNAITIVILMGKDSYMPLLLYSVRSQIR
jgi:hypothetical protein